MRGPPPPPPPLLLLPPVDWDDGILKSAYRIGVRSQRIWGRPTTAGWHLSSVVVAGFQDLDFVVVCSVDEPMFVVDPPGPIPGQFPFEWFWFSDASEWVALDFTDKSGDPAGRLAVGGQPKQEVLPGVRIEVDTPHSCPPAIS